MIMTMMMLKDHDDAQTIVSSNFAFILVFLVSKKNQHRCAGSMEKQNKNASIASNESRKAKKKNKKKKLKNSTKFLKIQRQKQQ